MNGEVAMTTRLGCIVVCLPNTKYSRLTWSGMGTRMMQALQFRKVEDSQSERESEIHNRTFWGCFIMDRLIFCGKAQPLALPSDKMTIHLPIGEQDFAFGKALSEHHTFKDLQTSPELTHKYGSIDNYYSILIRGFDIWAGILELVTGGGRRRPGMANPENCPWVD